MCYSRDWDTSEKHKRQEVEAAAAQRKRAGVVNSLLVDAEKKAAEVKTEKAATRETAPSK